MTFARVSAAIAVACIAVPASTLSAQGPESGLPDPAKCVVYSRALETGHPAPFVAEARTSIFACRAEVGHAYSTWLDRLAVAGTREEADRFLATPFLLRDGELFATALRVAANRTAPAPAREAALITLLNQAGSMWFGPLSAYEDGQACSVAEPSTPPDEARGSTPLPSDYLTSASAVIDTAANAGESVPEVRAVALCVKKNLYRRVHYHSTHSPALHPTTW